MKLDGELQPQDAVMWDLAEAYAADELDAAGQMQLEALLHNNPTNALFLAAYMGLHADLCWQHRGLAAAADSAVRPVDAGVDVDRPFLLRNTFMRYSLAASVVLAVGLMATMVLSLSRYNAASTPIAVATLVEATDAVWEGESAVAVGSPLSGGFLRLRSGTATIAFTSGAQVTVHGPAEFGLNSPMRAALNRGKITAYVPPSAHGFTVGAPRCAVVDLGTRFTMNVAIKGETTVRVNEGMVDLQMDSKGTAANRRLTIDQSVRIDEDGKLVELPTGPRGELALNFKTPSGEVLDRDGVAAAFTTRLPGTGIALAANDPNLQFDAATGTLRITSTRSDLHKAVNLGEGEYPALPLSKAGFDGSQDFSVTATFDDLPKGGGKVDQFGLFIGAASNDVIRGGFINPGDPNSFGAVNIKGVERGAVFSSHVDVGGALTVTISRTNGVWRVLVGDQDVTPAQQPKDLNELPDLNVGVFVADGGARRFTVGLEDFVVKIRRP